MSRRDSGHGMSKQSIVFAGAAAVAVAVLIIAGIMLSNGPDTSPIYAGSNVAAGRIAACPGCGQQGAPACYNCRSTLQWSGQRGFYACPRCQAQGIPYCPSCMRPAISQYRGAIGCIPPNPGYLQPQVTQPRSGFIQAA